MASEARKLKVGVFVIAATVIGAGTLIWLGASRFFEKTSLMVTYFSESVQGVESGTAVKYRGVPAGRVAEVHIAPDGELIEVVMKVDADYVHFLQQDQSLRAQLQLAGITGLRYLEIDHHSGAALSGSPVLDFEPPYPVIPSTPSSIKEIQDALDDIYQRVMSVDLPGISNDIRDTLQAANGILRDERVATVLNNISEISTSVAQASKNLQRITTDVDVKPAVDNLTAASADAKALMSRMRETTLTQVDDALGQVTLLAQSLQQFVNGLQFTIERVDRSIGNFEHLTEEVRDQPSRLLFADPPKPRRPADGGPR